MPPSPLRAVLFDLDGTLLDTLEDIADSANTALTAAGFATHGLEAYRYFVGDGVRKLVERALPDRRRDAETVTRMVDAMRSEYSRRWDQKTQPYEGVADLLGGLVSRGLACGVLSNKPHDFTRLCVERFFDDEPFAVVQGVDGQTLPKPDPQGAIRAAGAMSADPEEVLYLGDTDTDMQTARAAGMVAVGAAYGFRTAEELTRTGAVEIASAPLDVLEILDRRNTAASKA